VAAAPTVRRPSLSVYVGRFLSVWRPEAEGEGGIGMISSLGKSGSGEHDPMMNRIHFEHLQLRRLPLPSPRRRAAECRGCRAATSARIPRCRCRDRPRRPCPSAASRGPRSSVPTGYVSPMRSHGSSWACFRPSEIRLFSASTLRISTSTSSPFFTTSDGCCTRLVHDMSEMWIRPSMPGSIFDERARTR